MAVVRGRGGLVVCGFGFVSYIRRAVADLVGWGGGSGVCVPSADRYNPQLCRHTLVAPLLGKQVAFQIGFEL